jgi:serine/threonine protein kinase
MRDIGEEILGKYRIDRILGKGVISATYLTSDIDSGRHFVVKEILLSSISDWSDLGGYEQTAKSLQEITHPNLPRVIGSLTDEQNAAYLMVFDFIAGRSLSDLIAEEAPIQPDRVESIIIQILNALTYLHNQEPPIVHGDINPKNIIVGEDGTAALVDFGNGKAKTARQKPEDDESLDESGYTPLEHRYGAAKPESDLFSLGMTAVHLLTGKHPYLLPTRQFKPVFHDDGDKRPLYEMLDRMIEPDRGKRISSASRAAALLRRPNQQQHDSIQEPTFAKQDASSLVIKEGADSNQLTLNNEASRRSEYQLAGVILDLWTSKPWLIMLIALVASGGAAIIPFLILYGHPKGRSWINRAYSKIHNTRISVNSRTLSVSDQVKMMRKEDILGTHINTRKQSDGRLQVEVSMRIESSRDIDFYISNLTQEDADDAVSFLSKYLGNDQL